MCYWRVETSGFFFLSKGNKWVLTFKFTWLTVAARVKVHVHVPDADSVAVHDNTWSQWHVAIPYHTHPCFEFIRPNFLKK